MATSTTSSRIPARPTKPAVFRAHTGIPGPTKPDTSSGSARPARPDAVTSSAGPVKFTKTTGLMRPTPVRNIVSPSTNLARPSQTKASPSSISHRLRPVQTSTTIRKPKALTTETDVNVFSRIPDDIGEIRQLLQQLLKLLQDPKEGLLDLEIENRQLRQEVAELKEKLKMTKPESTITRSRPKSSGLYSTPLLE